MKFFTVFAAILSVALGYQASWTLPQLSAAIENPNTDPHLLPYLENALNEMMTALFAGNQIQAIAVTIPAIDLSTWTLAQLSDALQNPTTDAALVPYLEQALNEMMVAIVSGNPQQVTPVVVPAMDVSSWTLPELSAALDNPNTNPALIPYLEHALNDIMHALISGQQVESVAVAIPAGLLPELESPAPIPVVPAPVESPTVPAPVETPAAPAPPSPSSPLVQIVVNINQQSSGVIPAPVVVPEADKPQPVIVVDEAAVAPEPVIVVDTPTVIDPVQVVETPAIVPEPVIIGTPILPQPVIVVETPEVPINPVDVLHPIPVVHPGIAGAPAVGPIV